MNTPEEQPNTTPSAEQPPNKEHSPNNEQPPQPRNFDPALKQTKTLTSAITGFTTGTAIIIFSKTLARAFAGEDLALQERYSATISFVGILFLISAGSLLASSYLAGRLVSIRLRASPYTKEDPFAQHLTKEDAEDLLELDDDFERYIISPPPDQSALPPPESHEERLRKKRLAQVRRRIDGARTRLRNEISNLGRRGNLNLIIGGATTAFAIILLAYVSFSGPTTATDWRERLPVYILRVSVALFIEVFSFFFLRLYRANLQEIKYFQNELTNIESRAMAIEFALLIDDKDIAKSLIEKLAQTERNFVLKKGESTIELELARTETQGWREATAIFSNLKEAARRKQD
jgi:hypothetical protein